MALVYSFKDRNFEWLKIFAIKDMGGDGGAEDLLKKPPMVTGFLPA